MLNLLIVAAAGVLLRYKMLFPLPAIHYKNLLHAHSHFAFSGWVSLALFIAMTGILQGHTQPPKPVYKKLFLLGQLAAFGMLFTFPFMGYKGPSIFFSTVSILFSYLFAGIAWKAMSKSGLPAFICNWFKAALLFYVLSSAGAFHLAWLMASKTGTQSWYIGSVYFFLHFQYNGWFLFGIFGLFFYQLHYLQVPLNNNKVQRLFRLLFISCFPAFLLSALWMRLPGWLYWLAVAAVVIQIAALYYCWKLLWPVRKQLAAGLHKATRWLWILAFTAFSLKLLLQGLSAIPALSYLAFGFRPVVIGYLHLILLVLVTLFLLGYLIQRGWLPVKSFLSASGLYLFVTGVLLNELFLMLQGIAAINYSGLPVIHYYLLGASGLMFGGLACFIAGQWQKKALAKPT